jgi:structural maintenance of chromosome 2
LGARVCLQVPINSPACPLLGVRFKPAPLYILDEVDSALDLNNSQNIGRMIKQHFPQSQFLVVSHKDGFFNNANIIFRTKFVDGVSAVTRTVVQQADRTASGAVGGAENEARPGKAAAAARGGSGRTALRDANR